MVAWVTKACVLDSCPDEGFSISIIFYGPGFCFSVCLLVVAFLHHLSRHAYGWGND